MWSPDPLAVARTLTALVCGIIFVYGGLAFRRTHRLNLFLFALGMGTAAFGFLLEGALVEFGGWGLPVATRVESLFTLAAFGVLTLSIFVRDQRGGAVRPVRGRSGDGALVTLGRG